MQKKIGNNRELPDHACVYYMERQIGARGETNLPILPDLVEVMMGSSASGWNIERIPKFRSAGQSAARSAHPLRL